MTVCLNKVPLNQNQNIPKHKLADRTRHKREYSDVGDDIPKMELAKRIRECERRIEDNADASDEMPTASDVDSEATIDYYLADSMMIEGSQKQQTEGVKRRNIDHKMRRRNEKAKRLCWAQLLECSKIYIKWLLSAMLCK